MYKSNAYKSMVNGKTEIKFGTHHECRLGKWYDSGAGKERFSHLSSFNQMQKPHEIVHTEVHKNMVYIENKDRSIEHKEEIIKNFQSMEDASLQLFGLMDNLIAESEQELMKPLK